MASSQVPSFTPIRIVLADRQDRALSSVRPQLQTALRSRAVSQGGAPGAVQPQGQDAMATEFVG